MIQRIAPTVLAQGRRQYDATLTDENRQRRDPIITAFWMAMRLDGFRAILTPSSCLTLRACPFCPVGKGNYSTLYEKDGARVWACPTCETITDH